MGGREGTSSNYFMLLQRAVTGASGNAFVSVGGELRFKAGFASQETRNKSFETIGPICNTQEKIRVY